MRTELHIERGAESRPRSEKGRFVLNTLANGSAQLASFVASLVFMPLLVDAFGIGQYGLFMLASSIVAYAGLLDLGVGSALTKMVAEQQTKGEREALRGSIASALLFYVVVGVVVAVAIAVLGLAVGVIFAVKGESAVLLRNMLWLTALFQLWYWPASTSRHVLAGLQRYDVLAKTGLLATVLNIGAIALVLALGAGPVLLVTLSGLVTSLVYVVNIIVATRLTGVRQVTPRTASRARLRAIFAFSWAVFVVQLSDALFYQQTDRVLLGIFAGAAAVGLYEAAAKFSVLITYLSSLTVSAVLPLASAMGAEERHASLRALFVRGSKYGAALVAPMTVVIIVFAGPIIDAWLGPEFAGQALVAQVLVAAHIFVALGLMGDAIVISKGRLSRRIPYILAQSVLNVVLSAVLIGPYGILGVAIGTMLSHLVDFPIHIRFLLRETGVSLSEWLREVIAPVYPLLLLPLGVSLALSHTPLVDSLVGVFAAGAVAVALYWLAVLAIGLTPVERMDVRSALSAIRCRVRPATAERG